MELPGLILRRVSVVSLSNCSGHTPGFSFSINPES